MRKLSILALCSLISFACSKDSNGTTSNKTYCWKCTTTLTQTVTGQPTQTSSAVTEHCNLTAAQADAVEKSGTSTATSSSGGYTATLKYVTNCVKK